MEHSFYFWLVRAEIKCTVHVALPKRPINQFKVVQCAMQKTSKKAYSSNIYTVKDTQEQGEKCDLSVYRLTIEICPQNPKMGL